MALKELPLEALVVNPVNQFAKTWALVTAGTPESVNTMTISWGGIGELWGKSVTFTFIRPQRYTKEFVDREETYSVCFLGEAYRKQLSYLGTVSGRDENKIQKAGLTVNFVDETPYFEQADLVLVCRKLYRQELTEACFLDQKLDEAVYPGKDYHTMYVSQILKIYQKA